eukprot:12248005-Heterocapsa_arctica.AAC.1
MALRRKASAKQPQEPAAVRRLPAAHPRYGRGRLLRPAQPQQQLDRANIQPAQGLVPRSWRILRALR